MSYIFVCDLCGVKFDKKGAKCFGELNSYMKKPPIDIEMCEPCFKDVHRFLVTRKTKKK